MSAAQAPAGRPSPRTLNDRSTTPAVAASPSPPALADPNSTPALTDRRSAPTKAHRSGIWTAGLTAVVVVWLLTLVRPTLSNGDAASYLSQLLQSDLSIRTVHIGYLATALPWVRLEVLEPVVRLNLVSVVWGIVALLALLRLERRLSPERLPGWSAVWWLGCTPVLSALTTAEVYPAQGALLLLALAAWGLDRPVRAGVWWCLALSVSPTSVAALPAFLFHRAGRRAWGWVLGVGLLPMAVLVALLADDYLEGPRGLLHVPAGMSLGATLWYRGSAFPSTLGLGLIPLGMGLVAALDGRWPAGRRLLGAVALQAVAVWVLVDRFGDVPAQGLTLTLLTLVAGEGTTRLVAALRPGLTVPRAWTLVGLLAALHLVAADQAVRALRRREASFAALCRRVYEALPSDGRVVGTFSERRLYEWYAVGRARAGLTLELEALEARPANELRFLSLPSATQLPPGVQLRLEPDGSWSWQDAERGGLLPDPVLRVGRIRDEGRASELSQLLELLSDDLLNDDQVQTLVIVHRDIPEANHMLQLLSELCLEAPGADEEIEGLAALLWHTEPIDPDQMHGEIDGRLAGALKVQDDRVLAGEVFEEVPVISGIFLLDALQATFYDGSLVERDIIDHRWSLEPRCP